MLVSCLAEPAQEPTETATPTDTLPTASSTSTVKPSLTSTSTVVPTFTESPTATESPLDTPIPTRTFAPVPLERPAGDLISGTYKYERGDGGYCAIRAVLQPFVSPYYEVAIELFCVRGPPSYNGGYAPPQKILMSDNIAVYSVSEDSYFYIEGWADAPCHLVFQFGDGTITVTQLGLDFSCGFGHTVYADGVYTLIDPKPPHLGCLDIFDYCAEFYPLP